MYGHGCTDEHCTDKRCTDKTLITKKERRGFCRVSGGEFISKKSPGDDRLIRNRGDKG